MHRVATAAGLAAILASGAAWPAGVAYAQPGYSPPPDYEPGYAYGAPDVPPPEGYGYRDRDYDFSRPARDEDLRYADSVERWARVNCVREREQNQAAGAVIGGVLGAIIGSQAAGRHERTEGAIVGGALGAMAGSAIGASAGSPGCPPGYVVRAGAPVFVGPAFAGGYGYAAPPGYRPWIWSGGRWGYRPYPYHRYWYSYERRRGWNDYGDRRYGDRYDRRGPH